MITHQICKKEGGGERGVTLIEVLVSMSLFAIASLAIGHAFNTHVMFNNKSEKKSGAIVAAQQVLDQLRVLDPATFPTSGSDADRSVTVGSRTYTVSVQYCNPTTYCTSNNIRFIHVAAKLNGQTEYSVDTVFSQLR